MIDNGNLIFDSGIPLPKMTRDRRDSVSGQVFQRLKAMKVGQSFLMPVVIDTTIKDSSERLEHFTQQQKRLHRVISHAVWRFKKQHSDQNLKFSIRPVHDPVFGTGVRVWRVEPKS